MGARKARNIEAVTRDPDGAIRAVLENGAVIRVSALPRTDLRRLSARMGLPAGPHETNADMVTRVSDWIGAHGDWKYRADGDDGAPGCPKCHAPMVARTGKFGPFYGCTRYPSCRGTARFGAREPLPEPKAETEYPMTRYCESGHWAVWSTEADRSARKTCPWDGTAYMYENAPNIPEPKAEPLPEPKAEPKKETVSARILRAVRMLRTETERRGLRVVISTRTALHAAALVSREGWSLRDALLTSDLARVDASTISDLMSGLPEIKAGERTAKLSEAIARVDSEPRHEIFERALSAVIACDGLRSTPAVYLAGPMSSGKSEIAAQIARALDRPYELLTCNPNMMQSALFGYSDASGSFHETPLFRAVRDGAILLIDEADNASGALLAGLNSLLSNGRVVFDGAMLEKHPGFAVVMTANTWGSGPTAEFIGRLPLDPATLDRFIRLYVGIDERLESVLVANISDGRDGAR